VDIWQVLREVFRSREEEKQETGEDCIVKSFVIFSVK
jgi:hypothetical protein